MYLVRSSVAQPALEGPQTGGVGFTISRTCSGSMKYEAFKRLAQAKSTVANQQCLDVERFDLEFTLIQPDTHEVVTLKIPDNVTSAPKN